MRVVQQGEAFAVPSQKAESGVVEDGRLLDRAYCMALTSR